MPLRVLLQYNCVPHYRARLFELLCQQSDIHVTIAADSEPDTPFLRTISGGQERLFRHVCTVTKSCVLPGGVVLSWQPSALTLMREQKPDAVIALGSVYSLTAWVLCVMGRLIHIPVLLWGHGLLGNETGIKWWIRRALYRLAAGHLLYGDYAQDLLAKKGFPRNTLSVVYNSLDYDLQAQIASELKDHDIGTWRESIGVKPDERVVVFTGRLEPVKRLDMLVEAVGVLAKKGKRIHIVLVGEGRERTRLTRLAAERGLSDLIHFLGASYDERFLGLVLGSSDLCVIPSGAGLSIMHALVFGTPVLLHNRSDAHFPEWEAVQEGITGFFYRYGKVDDMAEKMDVALFPYPKKAAMAEACKRVIRERYNPHRQVEIFADAIRRSIDRIAA
jgi:glycosyltransferase involved in cell wall biosynthesis